MIQLGGTTEDSPFYSQLVENVKAKVRLLVGEEGCMFQEGKS